MVTGPSDEPSSADTAPVHRSFCAEPRPKATVIRCVEIFNRAVKTYRPVCRIEDARFDLVLLETVGLKFRGKIRNLGGMFHLSFNSISPFLGN